MAAEVEEAERGKAREALALLDDFSQRGKLLDESLDKFVRQYDELAHDFRELQLLGYEPTSYPLVQINMQAAVATKLQFTDLRQDFLAPHARRDFISVIDGWARHIRRRAEARLNRNAPGKGQLEGERQWQDASQNIRNRCRSTKPWGHASWLS